MRDTPRVGERLKCRAVYFRGGPGERKDPVPGDPLADLGALADRAEGGPLPSRSRLGAYCARIDDWVSRLPEDGDLAPWLAELSASRDAAATESLRRACDDLSGAARRVREWEAWGTLYACGLAVLALTGELDDEVALAKDLADASRRPRVWETAGLRLQRDGSRTIVLGAGLGRVEVPHGTGVPTVVVAGPQ